MRAHVKGACVSVVNVKLWQARVPNGAVAATPGRAAWSGCRENTKYLLLHVL